MKITYTKHAELKFKILGEHGCLITKSRYKTRLKSQQVSSEAKKIICGER